MTREDIDKKLTDAYKVVLDRCGNSEESRSAIDELLRIKQESCNVPQELEVRTDDVIRKYEIIPGMEITRCRNAIMLHSAGYSVVSKPTFANNLQGGALYQMLTWYCDYMDHKKNHGGKPNPDLDTACNVIITILTVPLDAFTDMDFAVKLATDIMARRADYYERLEKEASAGREESAEDAIANAEFEQSAKMGAELYDNMKELKEKRDAGKDNKR